MVTAEMPGLQNAPTRLPYLAGIAAVALSITAQGGPPVGNFSARPNGNIRANAAADGPTTGPGGGNGNQNPTGTADGGTAAPGDAPPGGVWNGNQNPAGTTGGGGDDQFAYVECTAESPVRILPSLCGNQATVDALNSGRWELTIDPDGTPRWTPKPSYDPTTGGWGTFNGAAQTCNPAIEVKLKQAALAGSQLTRAISDKQLSYPQTDPIEAVNNPQKDGAGGVCTIDIFAFDIGRLLGDTYAQIKNLIDALSNFSVDSLFGAACNVINNIFGNMQNQLLNELQTHSPLSQFQQFVNALQVGYISPLTSFASYGSTMRPTAASVPGLLTGKPLQVSYVPGKGYVYAADMGSGNLLVVNISQTPLSPADAVPPTPTPAPAR